MTCYVASKAARGLVDGRNMKRPRPTRRLDSAVKVLISAGVGIARVEIDNTGKIVIITGSGAEARPVDDLDQELADWEAKHGAG
jgi:hypothetical protein